MAKIKNRERAAILQALQAGLPPQVGIDHIYVGRSQELRQILENLDTIIDGGSCARFIIGNYGSGKSFLLNLAKLFALNKQIVVVNADVSTDKILSSSQKKSQDFYSQLMAKMSTKARPDGNALESIIQTWAQKLQLAFPDNPFDSGRIFQLLEPLRRHENYYDFCSVIQHYLWGYEEDNNNTKEDALRWLRGEYTNITDAKRHLDVRTIIKDNWYLQLKLMADFVVLAGYKGLLVCIDELAVLSRLPSNNRKLNYERILEIVNDVLPGKASHLGIFFGGTRDFLEDKQKGLFSYPALESRLAGNSFATKDRPDFSGPTIFLNPLSRAEFRLLSEKLRNVYTYGDESRLLTNEQCVIFTDWFFGRLGSKANSSPREFIKDFLGLLSQLDHYPDTKIEDYLDGIQVTADREPCCDDVIEDEAEPTNSQNSNDGLFDLTNMRL